MRGVLFIAIKVVAGAIGLWSGAITIAGEYGFPMSGIAAWTLDNSWWMFPLAMLACGAIAGWHLKRLQMAKDNVTAERIAELEAERDGLAARVADYEDAEAREAERRRRHLDGIARDIKDLHANVKLVILALYDDGPIRDLHFHDFGGAASFLSDYVDGEEIPPGNVIFTLKPEAREALDAHPEALARVRERIEADQRLRLPLEPDGSPGMEAVLKVSDGYALTRNELSTPAIPRDGRIAPAPARTEQAN